MHGFFTIALLVATGLAAHLARRALAPPELPTASPVASGSAAGDPAARAAAVKVDGVASRTGPAVASELPAAAAPMAGAEPDPGASATGRNPHLGRAAAVLAALAAAAPAADPEVANVLAREALRLVGKDPDALVIWRRAINDARLPAGDRSDLIEDLNDEGYDEQDAFTQADLELILARLRLIEQEIAFAMDDTNAWAFTEAYQDLLGMLVKARADVAATKARR